MEHLLSPRPYILHSLLFQKKKTLILRFKDEERRLQEDV